MSRLYFNNAFSKQPLPETITAMQPFLREVYENPLTETDMADRARTAIESARANIAALLCCSPGEMFFVSSGTEANNWALKGAAYAQRQKRHLVISAIEHFSVYQTAQYLARSGYEVTFVPVSADGLCDPDNVARAIKPDTFLVSIVAGSDEVGVIQDLQRIAALKARYPDVLFHTDAIQYLCYEPLDLTRIPLDLVSVSSNAIYGPSGIAALFVRDGTRLSPIFHGGMQEQGMRPGLQSTALIAGFGRAAAINAVNKNQWREHTANLLRILFRTLDNLNLPVTGNRERRLVDNAHVIADVDGEAVLTLLQQHGIAATSGSTCYQYAQKESHVLKAMSVEQEQARGALLFTLDFQQTRDDIDLLADRFSEAIGHLRMLKP